MFVSCCVWVKKCGLDVFSVKFFASFNGVVCWWGVVSCVYGNWVCELALCVLIICYCVCICLSAVRQIHILQHGTIQLTVIECISMFVSQEIPRLKLRHSSATHSLQIHKATHV